MRTKEHTYGQAEFPPEALFVSAITSHPRSLTDWRIGHTGDSLDAVAVEQSSRLMNL
jgi:hypothetical protein